MKIFKSGLAFLLVLVMAVGLALPADAASKPAKPSVTVTNYGFDNKIAIKKVANITGYEIYRSTTSAKSGFKKIKTVKTTKAYSYLDKNLKIGKIYYYKVRAYKGTAKGAFSAVKVAQNATKNGRITYARYAKVKKGMTYAEVKKVMGADGEYLYTYDEVNEAKYQTDYEVWADIMWDAYDEAFDAWIAGGGNWYDFDDEGWMEAYESAHPSPDYEATKYKTGKKIKVYQYQGHKNEECYIYFRDGKVLNGSFSDYFQ